MEAMQLMPLTAKEHIELIIENGSQGWFDHTDALAQYPIDAVLPHFEKVNEAFIRPAGWALLSENDKILKLIGWLKLQLQRDIEITFIYGNPVEHAIKYWAIQAVEYVNSPQSIKVG